MGLKGYINGAHWLTERSSITQYMWNNPKIRNIYFQRRYEASEISHEASTLVLFRTGKFKIKPGRAGPTKQEISWNLARWFLILLETIWNLISPNQKFEF